MKLQLNSIIYQLKLPNHSMAKTRKQDNVRNTGRIVISALKKLMKNTGWTTRTIVKFIKAEYSVTDSNLGRKVSRALKRGIRLGLVQHESGRYRLNNMSGLAQRVSSVELRTRRNCRKNRPKTKQAKYHRCKKHTPVPSHTRCCCSKYLV